MSMHNMHGCIKRLGEWIHSNAHPEGFTADAHATDSLCRIASDIRGICVEERFANRIVRAHDGVGSCKCSACGWRIDPIDAYCRRCGARLTSTIYERDGADDERR